MIGTRRRMIARFGRAMTLRRQTGVGPAAVIDVQIRGKQVAYSPEEITGGVKQGDVRIAILADEINAAGWPAPPRAGDSILVDRTLQVIGATPVHDGSGVIGFNIWARGGA